MYSDLVVYQVESNYYITKQILLFVSILVLPFIPTDKWREDKMGETPFNHVLSVALHSLSTRGHSATSLLPKGVATNTTPSWVEHN